MLRYVLWTFSIILSTLIGIWLLRIPLPFFPKAFVFLVIIGWIIYSALNLMKHYKESVDKEILKTFNQKK